MEYMTFSAYAKQKGISLQAVSQSFKLHKKEMDGMYIKTGRSYLLNDEGVRFMDEIRKKIVIKRTYDAKIDSESEEIIEKQKERIQELENKVQILEKNLHEEIMKKDAELIETLKIMNALQNQNAEERTKLIEMQRSLIEMQQNVIEEKQTAKSGFLGFLRKKR